MAAIFNPDVGGVPSANMPDQTNASRGQIADRSWEHIFEGAGAALKGAADAYNTVQKESIKGEVRKGFDDANEDFTKALPAELKKAGSSISALQSAYEQGKLSDTYYTGQLNALSKKLRAQYPLFEDYIDNTMQEVTGIRPANAFRNAVLQGFADEEAGRSDTEKSWDTWVKQNEDYIFQVAPDYFNDPEGYDRAELRTRVVKKKSDKLSIEQANLEISYLEKQDKLNEETASEAAMTTYNHTVTSVLDTLGASLGLNKDDFLKKLQTMSQTSYSPEEYQQVMGEIGRMKLELQRNLTTQSVSALDPDDPESKSFSAILGPTSNKAAMDAAMEQFNAIEAYATDQNWGMVGYYTRLSGLMQSKDLVTILNASPELRVANALSKISPELAQAVIGDAALQEGLLKDLVPEISANIAMGGDGFNAAVTRMFESRVDASSKAGGINALIDSNITVLTSPEVTPDQFKSVVATTYGVDEKGADIFTYIKPDEYEGLYRKMYSPAVTQAMVANGDKDLLQVYFQSAMAKGNSIPSLRKAAAAMQETNDFGIASTVEFIPGPNTLVVKTDLSKMNKNFTTMIGTGLEHKSAMAAVNSMNEYFATITPILEGMGYDDVAQQQVFTQILQGLNVELEGGRKEGFFEMLMNSVSEAMANEDADFDKQVEEVGKKFGVDNSDEFSFDLSSFEQPSAAVGDFGTVANTIIGFEGYSPTAYWDVNAYRTGFGSDTVTLADGTVQKVKKGTTINREDAERDLDRRVNEEFVPEIVATVGEEAWSSLSETSQAALASIAYNYGELPSKVAKAVKSGDLEEIRKAIQNLRGHNGGINYNRRMKEASMIG
jgi:GH24 family phage-related lysozyme (muramidase)